MGDDAGGHVVILSFGHPSYHVNFHFNHPHLGTKIGLFLLLGNVIYIVRVNEMSSKVKHNVRLGLKYCYIVSKTNSAFEHAMLTIKIIT